MLITISVHSVISLDYCLAFVQDWSLPLDRPIHFWLLVVPIYYFLKLLFSFVSVSLFFICSFQPFSFEQPLPLEIVLLFTESQAPFLFPLAFISFVILFVLEFHITPFQNLKRAIRMHTLEYRITLCWT